MSYLVAAYLVVLITLAGYALKITRETNSLKELLNEAPRIPNVNKNQ